MVEPDVVVALFSEQIPFVVYLKTGRDVAKSRFTRKGIWKIDFYTEFASFLRENYTWEWEWKYNHGNTSDVNHNLSCLQDTSFLPLPCILFRINEEVPQKIKYVAGEQAWSPPFSLTVQSRGPSAGAISCLVRNQLLQLPMRPHAHTQWSKNRFVFGTDAMFDYTVIIFFKNNIAIILQLLSKSVSKPRYLPQLLGENIYFVEWCTRALVEVS